MSAGRTLLAEGVSVPTDLPGVSWREVLFGAIRTEFRSELIFPKPGSSLFGHGSCLVTGCERGGWNRSKWSELEGYLCGAHHKQWETDGRPGVGWLESAGPLRITRARPCLVSSCSRSAKTGGEFCRAHASRWGRRDDPQIEKSDWAGQQGRAKAGRYECLIDGCSFPELGTSQLCDHHLVRARNRKLSPEAFVEYEANARLRERRHIDLRPLARDLRLEIQYSLQARHDIGAPVLSPDVNSFVRRLADLNITSLVEHDVEWYMDMAKSEGGQNATAFRRFLVQTLRPLHLLRDDAAEVDEWSRDVWRIDRLELDPDVVERSRIKSVSFVAIHPEWLRDTFKRWTKWRLQLGQASPTTISQNISGIRAFSEYLAGSGDVPMRPEDLTRDHLIRYLAFTNGLQLSASQKHGLISAVRHFLDEISTLGWLALRRDARYFSREIPSQQKSDPRFIPERVMAQLETREALARLPNEMTRTLLMLMMETGLRGKDARFLPVDPIVRGHGDQPYLQFFNHKSKRDAMIPISDELAQRIADQSAHVRGKFPETGRWLFPSSTSRDGSRAYGPSFINSRLNEWLGDLDLRSENGETVTVTAHQFRHTVGTRLLNDGVPLVAIQQFLDHSSSEMTQTYARMHDATMRGHVVQYHQRINRDGVVVEMDDGPLADAAWMREHFSRAKQALPNGYCGRPLVQACPHPNACLGCDHFLTDASFLPAHRTHLTQIDEMIEKAASNGWDRMVDTNKQDRLSLVKIIEGLERLENDGGT